MNKKQETCCFCGKRINGIGHNPQPLAQNGVCCDECNLLVVMIRLEKSVSDKKTLR